MNKKHQSLVHNTKGGTLFFFICDTQGLLKNYEMGLIQNIPQTNFKFFLGQTRNLQKTEYTRLRDFRWHNFCVYEPILSFLVLKMFKI